MALYSSLWLGPVSEQRTYVIKLILLLLLVLQIVVYIRNIFFHPLRRFPGPKSWAASRIPHEWVLCRGDIHKVLGRLHARYGEVVRVGPNALSFIHPDAWTDIYGRKQDQPYPLQRDPQRYTKDLWIDGVPDIWTSPDTIHPRLRRGLSPIFSDKAIRSYELTLQQHIDHWIRRMGEVGDSNIDDKADLKLDLSAWVTFLTSDIIGDLAFGETFGCIEKGQWHPFLQLVFQSSRAVAIFGAVKQFPWLNKVLEALLRRLLDNTLKKHQQLAIEKIDRRRTHKDREGDFLSVMLARQGQSDGLTLPEIYSTCNFLILAGSETAATATAGLIYHLCINPEILEDVQKEIRGKHPLAADITFESITNASFLAACLDESMRLYPPANFNPRITPPRGTTIAGHHVPEGTSVYIFQKVAYHSASNFENPSVFDPQRFLDPSKYKVNRLDAFHPLGVGPKNCQGYKIAYLEMKMAMAKLVWHYDLALCPESANWSDQEQFLLPNRPPLMVTLRKRQR